MTAPLYAGDFHLDSRTYDETASDICSFVCLVSGKTSWAHGCHNDAADLKNWLPKVAFQTLEESGADCPAAGRGDCPMLQKASENDCDHEALWSLTAADHDIVVPALGASVKASLTYDVEKTCYHRESNPYHEAFREACLREIMQHCRHLHCLADGWCFCGAPALLF